MGFFAGFAALVALVALVRGRLRWARLPNRAAAAGLLAVALLVAVLARPPEAATPTAAPAPGPSAGAPSPGPSETGAAPSPINAPAASPSLTGVLAAVVALPVKGRAPKTGYSRTQFGAPWVDVDGNGCDTRNDVLRRDLDAPEPAAGCDVTGGTLTDPYTGQPVALTAVDIDHVVALGDAWQKGAQQQPAGVRLAFANDPLNLLAVSASANRAKQDGDAATWLPPAKSFRCAYVARQIAVKGKYALSVTLSERDAMIRVLRTCPAEPVPTGDAPTSAAAPGSGANPPTSPAPPASALPVGPAPRATLEPNDPTTTRPAPTTQPAPAGRTVTPGAFCSPEGATGTTKKGKPARCTRMPGEDRARWRTT